jgi:hypothetical protein
MDKRTALLNKIYRAVHDLVCPNCGHDLDPWLQAVGLTAGKECRGCGFAITLEEMSAIRETVREWGWEAMEEFHKWRLERGNQP